MPLSRFPLILGAAGLAVATMLPLQPGPVLAQGADPVAERQAGLKRMGAHGRAIKEALDNKGDLSDVASRAREMESFFRTMPALFPPGSDKGDTKALPVVWSERAGFETGATRTADFAGRLATAAAAGDASASDSAFRELGGSCGACHRTYRAR
jgi:cytochrome c556